MSTTKFVPILQKSGPGRWWRWQNKITGSEMSTASYATFGAGSEYNTRVPRLINLHYLDSEASELEASKSSWLQAE